MACTRSNSLSFTFIPLPSQGYSIRHPFRTLFFSGLICLAQPMTALALTEEGNASGNSNILSIGVPLPQTFAALGDLPQEAKSFSSHSGLFHTDGHEFIDTFTGALRLTYVDIDWPGEGGLPMRVQRTYSGFKTWRQGMTHEFGIGWTINGFRLTSHSQRVYKKKHKQGKVDVHSYLLQLPDGNFKRFSQTQLPHGKKVVLTSPDNWRLHFSSDNVQATIIDPNAHVYTLKRDIQGVAVSGGTAEWTIIKEQDSNGNFINYEYKTLRGANYLSKMKASDGREIQFHYDRIHHKIILSSIVAGDKVWRYQLDKGELQHDNGMVPLLGRVIRPDGLMTTYYYHCFAHGCQISNVVHPTGGKTQYRYKTYRNTPELRQVASKTLWKPIKEEKSKNGELSHQPQPKKRKLKRKFEKIGRWKFQIPSESSRASKCGELMCVTSSVTGPDRKIDYQHAVVGRRHDFMADRGKAWSHGLLVRQAIYQDPKGQGEPLETQSFQWTKQKTSNDWFVHDQYLFDTQSHRALLTEKTLRRDETEYKTQFSDFDETGQPKKIIQSGPDGQLVHRIQYRHDWPTWLLSLPVKKTTDNVGTTLFDYDKKGNLIKHDEFGVQTLFAYDKYGQLTKKIDTLGRVWQYLQHYRGVATRVIQPDGAEIKQKVDTFGRVTAKTNTMGNTTSTQYDALDRPTKITPPKGLPTVIEYNKTAGPGGRTITRGNYQHIRLVNDFGLEREIIVRDKTKGEQFTQQFEYDAFGRKTFSSFLLNREEQSSKGGTTSVYDALDRVVETKTGTGNQAQQTTRYQYLPNRVIKKTDPNSGVTTSRYRAIDLDSPNQLLREISPSGKQTIIKRNLHGDILSVQQGGVTKTQSYNNQYQLIEEITPELGRVQYRRDKLGRVLEKNIVNADGSDVMFYDAMDRLQKIRYADGQVIQYHYDKEGNLRQTDNGNAIWRYRYDANNQKTQAVFELPEKSWAFDYHYDGNDALASMQYPDGTKIHYHPDVLGRPTSLNGMISSIQYTPFGHLQQVKYANGVATQWQYDNLQRLSTMNLNANNIKIDRRYQYDGAGNIVGINSKHQPHQVIQLAYDRDNQLIKATGPWGVGEIHYDQLGNITQKKMGKQNLLYHYDKQNRLKSLTGTEHRTFFYDDYGNIRSDGETAYQYNAAGELTDISNQQLTQMLYDANHHRFLTSADETQHLTLFDQNHHLLYEEDEEGIATKHYYLNGHRIASKKSSNTQKPQTTFHHYDHLGTKMASTDGKGNVIKQWTFTPFGQVVQSSVIAKADSDSMFTGKSALLGTELLDFSRRIYSPLLGRFMSVDPAPFYEGNTMSLNRYLYANNNPYSYLDPDGQFAIPSFLVDLFEGFLFGITWAGSDDDDHATSWSFYAGAGIGLGLNIAGVGSTVKSVGYASRGAKYKVEKLLGQKQQKAIWTSTDKQSSVNLAYSQWKQHQHEFPELENAKQYVEMAKAQWLARNQQMSTRLKGSGDVLYYSTESNTFTVFSAEGLPKTMYRLPS